MYSFRITHAICLLITLTQKFAYANYVENVSHQGITPAKVFTSFLKVPWINLNSSWTEKVEPSCRNDVTTLFESANAGEGWALQMLDAASKIPSGILTGNIRDLGMYEECIRVRGDQNPENIQGRHCMVSMSMPPKFVGDAKATLFIQKLSAYNPTPNVALNFAASLCLPSSCGVEDIAGLVNASIHGTPELVAFEVEVAQVTCSSVDFMANNFTVGTILAISFFALVALFLISCTVCDFVVKLSPDSASAALKTLAKFSLYTNAIKMMSTEIPPGTMPAINGIRFLSMCFVVTIHRILSTMAKPVVNMSAIWELKGSWLAPFALVLPYAVDTFFVLSGFLTAYLFLSKKQSGAKFSILELYLHRYLRLVPCIAALLLINIFILPFLGSGPIWEIVLGVTSDYCRKNWWTNLLYVQNFVNSQEMCMPHTWYSAAEMQLFWICPIILYPLFSRPKIGLAILSTFLITTLVTPAVHLVLNDYSFLFNTHKIFTEQFEEFVMSYTLTYNRALPYFVGLLLGYYVVKNKSKLTKVQATLNWIIACIFILFCFLNTAYIQPNADDYNAAWEAIYVSIGRLGWSLAIAWILYACTQGYGGPVGRFLSLPIFAPLSRMSYGIYLVSALIQVGINATEHTAEYHSIIAMVYLVWGDLAMSIVAAFILNLCFETPVIVLEKMLKTKRPSKIITVQHPPMGKREQVLSMIRQYPDLANGRVAPNSAIQTRMSQPDFWRIVSDVLNTSGKRPTKTPAEWIETWQDWKSDLSKNDSRRETRGNNGTQNGSAESKIEMIPLEKELLIFLAVVSCDSEDPASSKDSGTTEPAISQLGSYVLRDELSTFNPHPFTGKTSTTSAGNKHETRDMKSLP